MCFQARTQMLVGSFHKQNMCLDTKRCKTLQIFVLFAPFYIGTHVLIHENVFFSGNKTLGCIPQKYVFLPQVASFVILFLPKFMVFMLKMLKKHIWTSVWHTPAPKLWSKYTSGGGGGFYITLCVQSKNCITVALE